METVLVTGASSGIGLELARCFAADKSDLILVARNTEALENLASELREQFSVQVQVLTADLAQPESPQQIFDELKGRGLAVDVLVNNAGFGLQGEFQNLPLRRQTDMIQVNISALVGLTGLFLPAMIQRNRGGILNVGSVAGYLPGPRMAVYFATKGFVRSFSDGLIEDLRGTDVTVTNLAPGSTATNFSAVARGHLKRSKKSPVIMSAAAVAQSGYEGFRRRKAVVIPGASNWMLSHVVAKFLPRAMIRRLIGKFRELQHNTPDKTV
jgi:short-subunit dehydrogenase